MIESDKYDQAVVATSLAAQSVERFSLPGFQWAWFGIMTVNTKKSKTTFCPNFSVSRMF